MKKLRKSFNFKRKCIVYFKIKVTFLFFCSCGPSSSGEMVSRRKILSRSRDDLHLDAPVPEDEEDIWYHKEKLYKVRKVISEKPLAHRSNLLLSKCA